MPACSDEIASREATTTTMPSPKSGAVTPRASLVLMSEATVPQGTHDVHSREAGTKAPQRASLPSSSSTKLALRSGAKGSSLSVDSGAYAASTPKDIPKALSREARAEALFSANPLYGDKKNMTSSYVQPNRASALDRLGPTGSDLREFLTNKRKSESFPISLFCCQQVGCQLVIVHSVHCRLGPILASPPGRRSVFDRLSVQAPVKHRKKSVA